MATPIEEAIAALEAAGVRYIIVGGVAVVLHGHLRATGDLDLVIDLSEDNALRTIEALLALGYRPRAPVAAEAFADPSERESWIRDKNMLVFSMWRRAGDIEIDLFVKEPFDFEAVFRRAIRVELEHSRATVLALEDLIALKRGAGRPQDLADIAALEVLMDDSDV
jgi:predicted nucleotidyltransferase